MCEVPLSAWCGMSTHWNAKDTTTNGKTKVCYFIGILCYRLLCFARNDVLISCFCIVVDGTKWSETEHRITCECG
jgi:hypothetical protein